MSFGFFDKKYNKFISQTNIMIIGIQWWKWSFNESAMNIYIQKYNIQNFEVKYLYTTHNVMEELDKWDVDKWIFAIVNSSWWLVQESLDAIWKYIFSVECDLELNISHVLMCRKDVYWNEIDTIMAHPQVFYQCQNTLKKQYPNMKLVSGEWDLIDTAKIAECIANESLPKNTAVLWSELLAEIYNFQIIANNLQDHNNNKTRFLVVNKN